MLTLPVRLVGGDRSRMVRIHYTYILVTIDMNLIDRQLACCMDFFYEPVVSSFRTHLKIMGSVDFYPESKITRSTCTS